MDIKKQKYLVNEYPSLYHEKFAFSCGEGWFEMIDTLSLCIVNHVKGTRLAAASALKFNRALAKALNDNDDSWLRYYFRDFKKSVDSAIKAAKARREYRNVPNACDKVYVQQVKEKFGTLRIYVSGADEAIRGMINMTEMMSFKTCEVCGDSGRKRNGGWIRTLCDKHDE